MIKNIFTYLQYIQKYIYTIHIYIDLFTSRVEGLGHWNTMIRYLNTTLTKNRQVGRGALAQH